MLKCLELLVDLRIRNKALSSHLLYLYRNTYQVEKSCETAIQNLIAKSGNAINKEVFALSSFVATLRFVEPAHDRKYKIDGSLRHSVASNEVADQIASLPLEPGLVLVSSAVPTNFLPPPQPEHLIYYIKQDDECYATDAQFFYPQQQFFNPQQRFVQQPRRFARQGSVSRANSNAFEREFDLGPIGLEEGVTNSRAVTRQNGGQRNGGVTSVAQSNAINRELNLGGLDIGSTLTRTQTRTNGAVSRGVAQEFNVGNLEFGGSLSRDNLRRGFGLARDPNGGTDLNLGPLSLNLDRLSPQNNQAASTQAQVNAQGQGARARANSDSNQQSRQFGGLRITDTSSRSNAFGRVRNGQTSANTDGFVGGANTIANSFGFPFLRRRRGVNRRTATGVTQQRSARPKRRAQFIPFGYPNQGFQQQQRRPPYPQPGGFFFPSDSNAQSQGVAENKGDRFDQQAGSNSHSNQHVTKDGASQDNGASGISSNIAKDGSSGQVSSANANNQNMQTKDGSSSSNDAQSQSLNFDSNQQQASSANAGTTHTRNKDGENISSHGNSQSTNNNQFGSSSNTANTKTNVVRNGNSESVTADSNSQSIFQGANGQNAGASTNSNVNSQRGPDGSVSNSASSSASASSQGGGNANASASSSAGSAGNNAFTNANANAGGFNNNFAGFGGFGGFNSFGGFAGRPQNNRGAQGGWFR
ncbi:GATA zinc finger domain-containing protein 14 [Rhagoletis pomonella]|uniref:GATA zinc finger domain-containing protein 14 n=1 Tax=Rhagoletis pomonella TaxID=28610 RepID=UPI0017871BD4|nr:GATA zinc finger domain-containing protein 14 [Rhagoletis pomonella]